MLLSSHLFEEVERTCDRVAFIREGRLAAVERMDDVRAARKRVFSVEFDTSEARDAFVGAFEGARPKARCGAEAVVPGAMDLFVKTLAAFPVVDLSAREQTLEEMFMHLYGENAAVSQKSAEDIVAGSEKASGLKGGSHE